MKTKIRVVAKTRSYVDHGTKLGKIEYLHRGNVVDVTEYEDEAEFIKDIQDEITYKVPISVTLYRDQHGKTTASYALRKLEGKHCDESDVHYVVI